MAEPSFRDARMLPLYRRLLDAAPWSSDEQARIVDEARVGFRMTQAMFEELDRSVVAGTGA